MAPVLVLCEAGAGGESVQLQAPRRSQKVLPRQAVPVLDTRRGKSPTSRHVAEFCYLWKTLLAVLALEIWAEGGGSVHGGGRGGRASEFSRWRGEEAGR